MMVRLSITLLSLLMTRVALSTSQSDPMLLDGKLYTVDENQDDLAEGIRRRLQQAVDIATAAPITSGVANVQGPWDWCLGKQFEICEAYIQGSAPDVYIVRAYPYEYTYKRVIIPVVNGTVVKTPARGKNTPFSTMAETDGSLSAAPKCSARGIKLLLASFRVANKSCHVFKRK